MNTIKWENLAAIAWEAYDKAFIIGKTKVGAALLSKNDNIYSGCNVEHRYRNHDVHAEINAITNMVNNGETNFIAIIIVAERENFSPCGSCLDWIFQFGGENCLVSWQSSINGAIKTFRAKELMPQYPF